MLTSSSDIDNAFRNAFLYGIHHQKDTNRTEPKFGLSFPLSQSFVMASFVLPYLPIFTPKQAESLVIKKTSWKNARKFIKALHKEKLLLSKDRPGNEVDVLDVDFEDGAFQNRLPKKETSAGSSNGPKAPSGNSEGDDSIGQQLKKVDLFRPKDSLAPLFKSADKGFVPFSIRFREK